MGHYDAIVVGAGPAGSTAAYTLAKKGKRTALLERGREPGEKNVYGGTIYSIPTRNIFPHFKEELPLERAVVKEEFWILEETSAVNFGFTGLRFHDPPYNKFTVRRSTLDPYLAQKAVEVGAFLHTETLATGIKKRGRQVVGVKINGEDSLEAPAVILAEGVQAALSRKMGLHPPHPPDEFTLYVKEVLGLKKEKIQERFQLNAGEGAIIGIMGYPLAKVMGRAAIWTEDEALILIVGAYLDDLVNNQVKPHDLLGMLKEHPLVKRLLEGSELLEYQGHMIPKGGSRAIPRLYHDGLLLAGDAATMISGRRGTDLAMMTGQLAAETLINAFAKGDLSSSTLALYKKKVDRTFFMQDIKAGRKKIAFKNKHPDSEHLLSVALNKVAHTFFETGMKTKKEKEKEIKDSLKELQPPLKSIGDMLAMARDWEAF